MTAISSIGSPPAGLAGALRVDAPAATRENRDLAGAAADQDTVTISQEGRALVKAFRKGKGQGKGQGDDPLVVDKDEVVKDLQDTETDIRKAKEKIDELKRQAMTDESKKDELARQKVKLDGLNEEAKDMEGKLSR